MSELTMTSHSDGIGFTFRSSLSWFSLSGPSVWAWPRLLNPGVVRFAF